ncbi:hypothetical protein INS49_015636 [Diaporthe citri]|uniref:uncharacterized protein n=1 Tax=Diaporthe citri TaxID=83186 RepID=UPI001C7F4211|nr:uncharacterized protein INS49_015636 [Diaporthe citri]KAG6356249.1 hypothetical protein INS49_015636 [Diaporthe citri]
MELYKQASAYFGHSGGPYSLYVLGQQLIVVTQPEHKAQIFKDNEVYSFDTFIDLLYSRVGNVSDAALAILWRKPCDGFVSLHPNPKQKVLVHTGQELLHKQLLSPGPSRDLLVKAAVNLELNMRWDAIASTDMTSQAADRTVKVIGLHSWCRDVAIGSQTDTFFGPYLSELEPDYRLIYDQWDINSWMSTYSYPSFMAKPATVPREKLVKVIMGYLDGPPERKSENVAYVSELEQEMRHAGLDSETCARILMMILWGLNSNVQMTTFWVMVHILQDAALVADVRKEIVPIMEAVSRTKSNYSEMMRDGLFRSCPVLNSVFNEILRFYNTGSSMRETTREACIAGKTIPKGTKIILPQRQLLLAPEAFGEDAQTVNPYRFVQNKDIERHEYYRPFGQGITHCSGKTIGRFEVLAFVAWALWRYKLKVVALGQKAIDGTEGKTVPRIDLKKPSLGISKQIEGDDLVLEVRQWST